MLQGQYLFTNDFILNIDNHPSEQQHLSVHENIHKIVSSTTTIGTMLLMMEKISIVDNEKKWLFDCLLEMSNKMQESVATTIEYLSILKTCGENTYKEKIHELKSNNKKYYDYLMLTIKHIPENKLTNIDEVISTILASAILSMNIDISLCNFQNMKNKKDFQRFITKDNNAKKYNINNRYKIFIKALITEQFTDEYKMIESVTLLTGDFRSISENTIFTIYSKSPYLDRIKARVQKIQYKAFPLKFLMNNVLSAFPFIETDVKLNFQRLDMNEIKNLLIRDHTKHLHFNHILAGLEDINFLYCKTLGDDNIYACLYELGDIDMLLTQTQNPIIFHQYKLYRIIKNKLKHFHFSKDIYLVMDNAILNNIEFIYEEFVGSTYFVVQENKYDILVVKKDNTYLLQLCMKGIDYIDLLDRHGIKKCTEYCNLIKEYSIKRIANETLITNSYATKNKPYGFHSG